MGKNIICNIFWKKKEEKKRIIKNDIEIFFLQFLQKIFKLYMSLNIQIIKWTHTYCQEMKKCLMFDNKKKIKMDSICFENEHHRKNVQNLEEK